MAAKLAGGGGGRYSLGQNSEINVTPFVDILLVLLIIFMVAAPLLSRPIALDLPTHSPKPPPPPEVVTLRIDPEGGLHWNGRPLPSSAIDAVFRIEAAREVIPLLALEVSPEADYGHVTAILGRARAAGLERIGVP